MAHRIREAEASDDGAIRAVLEAAFPSPEEALIVEKLRAAGRLRVSLVAESEGAIVGYIAFSPVEIDGYSEYRGVGLAPAAVTPGFQRRGIGTDLTRAGIQACRAAGEQFVVVVGHPRFYPRFGFRRGALFGLENEYGAAESFMALELEPGALPRGGGLVLFAPELRLPPASEP